ncbi:MAG: tRNA lysidine(34) synthetase TilS [Alphaproteobacteria bacterium]|nr:tRNA lysidine(34) synthetase TilS [Alphaproteobacteria bacterium]
MITPEAFALSMKKLGMTAPRPRIAAAVSGGGDSLALTFLLQEWIRSRGGEMLALTVDHGLRPGSAGEAAQVRELLQARGVAHEILHWEGNKPSTHVQELAREARYELLLQACQSYGFPVLAVAHNLEDQLETFWMRLAHGSGLDGLSAMAPSREAGGVSIIRPVLPFSRAQLRETCAQHDIHWIEDPSNRNEKYLRVKLRQFENLLAEEGLTPARLSQTLQKLEDAREALQVMTERAAASCVRLHPEGYAALKISAWKEYPRDIQRRILGQALGTMAASAYPPGFEALEQTRLDLHDPAFAGKTLAGCEIFPGRSGDMLIAREAHAVAGRVSAAKGEIWDDRFRVSGFVSESLEIGALGEAGLAELRKNIKGFGASMRKLEALPFKVKRVLPALWQGENLLAVPHVSYYSPASPPALKTGQVLFVKIV